MWLLLFLSLIFLTSKPSKTNKELSRTVYCKLQLGGGHEFEQTLGDSEGQGSLVCGSSWGCKEFTT